MGLDIAIRPVRYPDNGDYDLCFCGRYLQDFVWSMGYTADDYGKFIEVKPEQLKIAYDWCKDHLEDDEFGLDPQVNAIMNLLARLIVDNGSLLFEADW